GRGIGYRPEDILQDGYLGECLQKMPETIRLGTCRAHFATWTGLSNQKRDFLVDRLAVWNRSTYQLQRSSKIGLGLPYMEADALQPALYFAQGMGHRRCHKESQDHEWQLNRKVKELEKDVALLDLLGLQSQVSHQAAGLAIYSICPAPEKALRLALIRQNQLAARFQHFATLKEQAVNLVIRHFAEGENTDDLVEGAGFVFILDLQRVEF